MSRRASVRLDGPGIARQHRARLEECALVFDLLDAGNNPGLMIDVGAHFGGSLAAFSRVGWKVLAFEPDAANRAKLEERMAASPQSYADVTISTQAVSDAVRDDVAFFASPVSTGISGLSAFHESHSETARVSTTTLNHVVAEHALEVIDFLKIDVEGHEMSVLSGLDFDRLRPRAIIAEFENSKTIPNGYTTADLANFLAECGYTVLVSEWYPIERYGVQHQWRRLARWPVDVPDDAWGNLVALLDRPDDDSVNATLRRNIDCLESPLTNFVARVRRFVQKRLG